MIPDIRTAVCFFIFVGAIQAGHAVAQEDSRVLPAAEEIPAPPAAQKLLDFVPTETSDFRIPKTRNSQGVEMSTGRVDRITNMLSELKKKARRRESVRRLPTDSPMESPANQSREPSFVELPPPAPPPIVHESKEQNPVESNLVIQQTRPLLKTTPVSLTTTVDSLSLANNLFAQGKVEMAQSIYEKLQKTPHSPSDLIWIQYQLACCCLLYTSPSPRD